MRPLFELSCGQPARPRGVSLDSDRGELHAGRLLGWDRSNPTSPGVVCVASSLRLTTRLQSSLRLSARLQSSLRLRLSARLQSSLRLCWAQYNVLKIARHLFRWHAEVGVADFYERALLNGIIGNQLRPSTHPFGSSNRLLSPSRLTPPSQPPDATLTAA